MWEFEQTAKKDGYQIIAGVDEAGRGPLAGPVVSAAVVFSQGFAKTAAASPVLSSINDSKKLTEKKRLALFPLIRHEAVAVGIGIADHLEIDTINILQASLLSMKRAVADLSVIPDYLLIDGKFTIDSPVAQQALVKGDSRSFSIAAASIIAKVTRARLMADLDRQFPQHQFARHKGYPTKAHKQAILEFGPSSVHRRTFKGVKEVIGD